MDRGAVEGFHSRHRWLGIGYRALMLNKRKSRSMIPMNTQNKAQQRDRNVSTIRATPSVVISGAVDTSRHVNLPPDHR